MKVKELSWFLLRIEVAMVVSLSDAATMTLRLFMSMVVGD